MMNAGLPRDERRAARGAALRNASPVHLQSEWFPEAVERPMAGSVHRFKQESDGTAYVPCPDQPELRSAVATALIDSWMPSRIRGSASPARWRLSNSICIRLRGSI